MFASVDQSQKVREQLRGVNVYFSLFEVESLAEEGDFADEWRLLKQRWIGKTKSEVQHTPRLAAFRKFYGSIGFDARQTPPSVENLITRFLIKADSHGFPNISPIVNAINVAAVDFEVPLGIFDTHSVDGEICLDFSVAGEMFQPLGKVDPIALDGGKLVLRDSKNILSIFCYRDGEKQKITPRTRSVAVLGCQVPGIDASETFSAMERAIRLLKTVAELRPGKQQAAVSTLSQ